MKPPGNTRETRKQIGCIHARPVSHIDAGFDIDAIGSRVENKKLEMMSDRLPGSRVVIRPNSIWPGSGSKP
jgi:hypothetical protein